MDNREIQNIGNVRMVQAFVGQLNRGDVSNLDSNLRYKLVSADRMLITAEQIPENILFNGPTVFSRLEHFDNEVLLGQVSFNNNTSIQTISGSISADLHCVNTSNLARCTAGLYGGSATFKNSGVQEIGKFHLSKEQLNPGEFLRPLSGNLQAEGCSNLRLICGRVRHPQVMKISLVDTDVRQGSCPLFMLSNEEGQYVSPDLNAYKSLGRLDIFGPQMGQKKGDGSYGSAYQAQKDDQVLQGLLAGGQVKAAQEHFVAHIETYYPQAHFAKQRENFANSLAMAERSEAQAPPPKSVVQAGQLSLQAPNIKEEEFSLDLDGI